MRQLIIEVEYLKNLGTLVSAYEEIAATRMQLIRNKVLTNRDFMTELAQIFHIVKSSYQSEVRQHKIVATRIKIGKTARVLISANTGLYGDIVQRTFSLLKGDITTSKTPSSVVVVGSLGKTLFSQARLPYAYVYFDFPDTGVVPEKVKSLVDYLSNYETVVIYHGLFKSIISQETSATNISGGDILPEEAAKEKKRLIFEPTLSSVLTFFETEIFSSLLLQSIYEATLAKFSSRMTTLNQAEENIKKTLKLNQFLVSREKHRLANRKQRGLLTGRELWGVR